VSFAWFLPGVLPIQHSFFLSLNANQAILIKIADPLIIPLISSSFFSNQQSLLNYLSMKD
jgi:hypothetical protein